ncbi:MAG: gamma-glutamylcyclotransferase family protein [Desulfobacteria bacterium]
MTYLYFAYGSNMDKAQMDSRCNGVVYEARAVLQNAEFLINNRGVATVVPKEGSAVYGCVWRVTEDHLMSLDGYEGVAGNLYRRQTASVQIEGVDREAIVYLSTDKKPGAPRPGYLERILNAAREIDLPVEYIQQLEKWRRMDG